ncbi:hypothetical protein [Nonomuraea zeae]|uniref:Uncharacterized protein n=1 Tax=Nonomuraea zeae TaxID=1642303 RepID=A0A5S4GIZ3_9ACTN|nr:hypothetical protein [Nonomuraea zeae]TMR32484.1 hypothetical protein ETD85_22845 [Nonomuraea zeae]
MRRYRFGRIAALLAAVYVAAVVGSGVLALATGDPELLREIVTGGWDPEFVPYTWWVELLVVAGGVLQGWAYWQVLRGRRAGAAAVNARPVRLLRAALYLSVACTLGWAGRRRRCRCCRREATRSSRSAVGALTTTWSCS